jgi:hypothetical protein
VVACIAAGALLIVVAAGLDSLLARSPDGGWFMYIPNAEPIFSAPSPDTQIVREGAVWLAAVALWFGVSWWLFRDRD